MSSPRHPKKAALAMPTVDIPRSIVTVEEVRGVLPSMAL
jgi:hypothetical protein